LFTGARDNAGAFLCARQLLLSFSDGQSTAASNRDEL
jgi:hypothetical protein